MSLEAARAVVQHLTLRADRTRLAASGLLLATDVADYLVGRGVPFRDAHEIVGAMVRKLLAEKRDFDALSRTNGGRSALISVTMCAGHHAGGLGPGAQDTAIDSPGGGAAKRLQQTRGDWLLHYRDLSS